MLRLLHGRFIKHLYAVVQQHECTQNSNTNSVTSTCSHGPVFRSETSAFKIAIFAGGFKLTHTSESVEVIRNDFKTDIRTWGPCFSSTASAYSSAKAKYYNKHV